MRSPTSWQTSQKGMAYVRKADPQAVMGPCQVYRCHRTTFAEVLTPANHVDVQTNTPALTLADTMLFRAETLRKLPLTTPKQVRQV